jgi:hypothetical protein
VSEIGQQLAANVAGARSPLRKWLFENRDEIAAVLAAQARPGWQALAATAAQNGVRDKNGNSPSAGAVRWAWRAIERSMNRKEPNRLPQIPANPSHQLPVVETQPVQNAPPAIPEATFTMQSRPRNVFKVATFKKDT